MRFAGHWRSGLRGIFGRRCDWRSIRSRQGRLRLNGRDRCRQNRCRQGDGRWSGGRRGGLRRRCRWLCRFPCAGKAFDHGLHRIARLAVLDGVQQGGRCRRAADQRIRIREDQRIVPWALHHERQLERGRRIAGRDQAGNALQVIFARRHGRRSGQQHACRGAFDPRIFRRRNAIVEPDCDVQ